MPAASSQQVNGFSMDANGLDTSDGDYLKIKLANKKLELMEQEYGASEPRSNQSQEAEVFHDTSALGAHTTNRRSSSQDTEPIVIYSTQSNTSIAQTAKDQMAAALLRLQSGLDSSTLRLSAIETRVDELVKQQRQKTRSNQEAPKAKRNNWLSPSSSSHLNTLIYLSWPVLVFVAMRALEKRALLKKLS